MCITPTPPSTASCPPTLVKVGAKFLLLTTCPNHQGGDSGHPRRRSPQVKSSSEGNALEDVDGFRRQGRPRNQNRPAVSKASKVVVENVGELQPSLQYNIGT